MRGLCDACLTLSYFCHWVHSVQVVSAGFGLQMRDACLMQGLSCKSRPLQAMGTCPLVGTTSCCSPGQLSLLRACAELSGGILLSRDGIPGWSALQTDTQHSALDLMLSAPAGVWRPFWNRGGCACGLAFTLHCPVLACIHSSLLASTSASLRALL